MEGSGFDLVEVLHRHFAVRTVASNVEISGSQCSSWYVDREPSEHNFETLLLYQLLGLLIIIGLNIVIFTQLINFTVCFNKNYLMNRFQKLGPFSVCKTLMFIFHFMVNISFGNWTIKEDLFNINSVYEWKEKCFR